MPYLNSPQKGDVDDKL